MVCGARRGPTCVWMEEKQEKKDREERLIVGLGNPESEYADTRHNLGFACVRELARRLGVPMEKKRWQSIVGRSEAKGVWLVMPQTYMNLSGRAVAKALKDTALSPQQTWVVYDELDLALAAGVERAMDRYNRPGALGCEELA